MANECFEFLKLPMKPALIGCREASWLLGMHEDWIYILVQQRILPVAGKHESGCQFYFSSAQLTELAQSPDWCSKAVLGVRKHFRKKNQNSSRADESSGKNGL